MKTALIILNYNNASATADCLRSILKHNTAPVKFVIVDNCSQPDQRLALSEAITSIFPSGLGYSGPADMAPTSDAFVPVKPGANLPDITLVQTGANLGYGRGNNAGLELVHNDQQVGRIMILNNDILFIDDIIPHLIERMDRLPDCAIISPVLYTKDMRRYDYNCARRNITVGRLIRKNFTYLLRRNGAVDYMMRHPETFLLADNRERTGELEIELPSGSCMLIDKNYFDSIGRFDPATFMYYEENILYKKIAASGRRNYLSLDCKCIHLGAVTTSKLANNMLMRKASADSEKHYVDKYSGASLPLKLLHHLSVDFTLAGGYIGRWLRSFALRKTRK